MHSFFPLTSCSEVFLQGLQQSSIVCCLLYPHHFHRWRLQWLPAFSSLNAMLMQALHSLITLFPLVYPPQFVTNGPTTTPPSLFFFFPSPSPPFSSPMFSPSSPSLEASRFSSFAFSHNAMEWAEWVGWGRQWGAFKRAVGGSGV